MILQKKDTGHTSVIRTLFAAGLFASPLIFLPASAQADSMMSVCAAEISAVCSGVSEGRGRISACLYANDDSLSGACKSEVFEVSSSKTFQRYLPAGTESLQGSKQETDLRAACTADADKVCTDLKKENGRLLACVYSRSSSVSSGCWEAAKIILD